MSRQVSRGSAGEYQADQQAGVKRLSCRVSGRLADRCRAAPLASIQQVSRQVSRGSAGDIKPMIRLVSHGSADDYPTEEQAGFAWFSWRISSR